MEMTDEALNRYAKKESKPMNSEQAKYLNNLVQVVLRSKLTIMDSNNEVVGSMFFIEDPMELLMLDSIASQFPDMFYFYKANIKSFLAKCEIGPGFWDYCCKQCGKFCDSAHCTNKPFEKFKAHEWSALVYTAKKGGIRQPHLPSSALHPQCVQTAYYPCNTLGGQTVYDPISKCDRYYPRCDTSATADAIPPSDGQCGPEYGHHAPLSQEQ